MQSGTIKKQTLLVWLLNCPSRKATRDFLHVFLRVTAVDAERVQLHQLARIVFVEAAVDASRFVSFCRIRTGHAGSPIVEIEKHRRRVCGRAEQISKATHGKGPYRFAVESGEQIAVIVFVREDAEMVLPKINHQLEKLLFAVNGAQEFRALQFSHDHLRVLWRRRWFG